MSEFVDYGDAVFFIREGDDVEWIHKKQDEYDQMGLTSRLFYVPVDGCDDKYLHPHRFIVENYDQSLTNHMLWEGILGEDEQMDYMLKLLRDFQKTNKQFLVEDVEYDPMHKIYDYTITDKI